MQVARPGDLPQNARRTAHYQGTGLALQLAGQLLQRSDKLAVITGARCNVTGLVRRALPGVHHAALGHDGGDD